MASETPTQPAEYPPGSWGGRTAATPPCPAPGLPEPRRLILRSDLALGDTVLLTAAIRDLHRLYPGRFITDVRTAFPDLWAHNPHVRPLAASAAVETIDCDTPLVGRSGRTPCHYLYAFQDFLNRRLGLRLEPTEFRGDVYLSEAERAAPSALCELTGREVPFWIVSAGGRYDLTIKWWSTDRYQAVVDRLRGQVQFVQVGNVGHHHPRLDGVVDLRGRTSLRQLIRLVYHAEGILCGVTALMHLAAAVPRPARLPGLRPCVVIAGGREPPTWEAYPGHQFLHTVGALPCCRADGCWKARTRPLGDGAAEDSAPQLCVDVVGVLPRCMNLITADGAVQRIETYLDGGAARRLRKGEVRQAIRAVSRAGPSDFERLPLNLSSARMALEAFLAAPAIAPRRQAGRGIVICAGGAAYFANAWVTLNALRRLGCRLPIQLWHLDDQEMDPAMKRLVAPLQVECIDASVVQRSHPVRVMGGWVLKPYALLFSPFREVLLIDADNVPVRDPTFLFRTAAFRESGAVFWPDHGRSARGDPLWRCFDLAVPAEREFESGQVLVDKRRCWRALRLTLWLNEHSDFVYQYFHGDKDTFNLAFCRLGTPYHLVRHPPLPFRGGAYQHDDAGRRLFQHRNTVKWSLMPHHVSVPGFEFEAECLGDLARLRRIWDGRRRWLERQAEKVRPPRAPRRGTLRLAAWMVTCPERESVRRQTLASLAESDWPDLPLQILVDPETDGDRLHRMSLQVQRAMQLFLDGSADYFLLLEDDLVFNRHLRHNLTRWPVLREGRISLAGLYNPGHRELAYDVPANAVAVEPGWAYGSQALLLTRWALERVLPAWSSRQDSVDHRIIRLSAQLGRPLYWHAPSLVQHRECPSTWGGVKHQAADFQLEWRAAT